MSKETIELIVMLQPFVMTALIAIVHAFTAYARRELERAQASADKGDDVRAAKLYARAMQIESAAKWLGDLLTLGLTYRQRQARAPNPTPSLERVEGGRDA